jgi:hypothetical protein
MPPSALGSHRPLSQLNNSLPSLPVMSAAPKDCMKEQGNEQANWKEPAGVSKQPRKRGAQRPREQSAGAQIAASAAMAEPAASARPSLQGRLPERSRADNVAGTAPHHGSHEANPIAAADTSWHQGFRYCDYYSFMSLADFLA